ncbi:family 12 glycoside hydrolase [Cryphonectria parasitica EP155]|uniref:Family 12 glycoside hydrolase n=1 Tax=Cryphonectria parasitica (strain ATCC 38755 / EP155) TaxID=660469 RepID=A0A9P4Y8T0_CRYP1|nr:family 12 glycoside hydrolase [Cryphonectria parasitica EP155]KAF3768898.1 family 12 glycoside hydrolase [Cryphonectria parasitica EP155]
MKCTAQIASLVLAATSVLAAPATSAASPLARRDESCDSFYEWDESPYTIYQNNWGAAEATSGSQCTTVTSVSDDVAVWSTSWTWAGGSYNVKSYSNVGLMSVNKQLSAVSSIPSSWTWSYTGSDLVADVSYDLWLAPTSGGTNSYEIMVWLAALGGAGPISSSGSAIATPEIGGYTWSLYSGPNGDTTVYSFVASSEIEDWSGDMMDFFNYLVEDEGVSDSLYITQLQAGTEPFTGTDAVFSTSAYSISVE